MASNPDILIQSLAIRVDQQVEITYMETRDQGTKAALLKTVVLDSTLAEEEIDEILEAVQELVDLALLNIRNPDETLRR